MVKMVVRFEEYKCLPRTIFSVLRKAPQAIQTTLNSNQDALLEKSQQETWIFENLKELASAQYVSYLWTLHENLQYLYNIDSQVKTKAL